MAFIKGVRRAYRKSGLKKTYRKVRGMAKKRYGGSGGRSKLARDVAMLKHLVNTEKKRADITVLAGTASVGLTAGAGVAGQYAAIITPTIPENVTGSGRNGNSVKLVSACMDIQFAQQANTLNNLKLKYWIVCKPDHGTAPTATNAMNQFLEVNPFSGQNDFYSSRDPEYFTNFQIVRTGVINIHQDQITGGQVFVQKKVLMKLNHHLKFNSDASTVTTKNQFYFFCAASFGDTVALTGATIVYNVRWYYTDN